VANHLEPDHSGCLVEAVERIKPEKIFVSPMGKRSLESIYHTTDWPLEICKSGTSASIGSRSLQFVETRMLHWPDNMVTYIPEEKMLICSDAFGQNWATSERFADEVEPVQLERLLKEYFANIVQPYSPVVLKTLDGIESLGLDIDMLAPDHGLIWRGEDVKFVLDKYREYSMGAPKPKALIFYDTMWHSTEAMADAIATGLKAEGIESRIMHVKKHHHSAIMTELMDCGAVVAGSPTHNNGILPYMASTLTYMKGLRPQNKVGAAFGSFGWSGECVNILSDWLGQFCAEVMENPIKVKNCPTHEHFEQLHNYGKEIAKALKARIEAFEG
jgi:flavorubredoxin